MGGSFQNLMPNLGTRTHHLAPFQRRSLEELLLDDTFWALLPNRQSSHAWHLSDCPFAFPTNYKSMSKRSADTVDLVSRHKIKQSRGGGGLDKGKNDKVKEQTTTSGNDDSKRDDGLLLSAFTIVFQHDEHLKLKDLQSLLNTSKAVGQLVAESYPWEHRFLREYSGPCTCGSTEKSLPNIRVPPPFGFVSRKSWESPHFPNENLVDTVPLHIPPRARARDSRRPDDGSFYPHRNDKAAKGFVLAENGMFPGKGLMQFNAETGVLEDLFYPEQQLPMSGPTTTDVYIPRELSIHCSACGVTCHSYRALVDHCTTFEHQNNSIPPHRRLPKQFWDPRNSSCFAMKSPFEKTKALLTFRQNVLDALQAPMDAAGKRTMQEIQAFINDDIVFPPCPLQFVTFIVVRMVVDSFYHDCPCMSTPGVATEGHVRDILSQGWGAFRWYRPDTMEEIGDRIRFHPFIVFRHLMFL